MLQALWELGPVGMVLGRRKSGAMDSSATSAMHRAGLLPKGSTAVPPTPGSTSSSSLAVPVLSCPFPPLCPQCGELPGAGTLVRSQQKLRRVLSHRERCGTWICSSMQDSSKAIGSQTGPSGSPRVPCSETRVQQEQESAGAPPCAAQDVSWHSP